MKTLQLKTLVSPNKPMPKTGCFNVKLLRQGNGLGTLPITLKWGPFGEWKTVTIDGGVFIIDGVEKTVVENASASNTFIDTPVKLYKDVAYLSFSNTTAGSLIYLDVLDDGTDPNRPIVDYNYYFGEMYDLVAMFARQPMYNRPIYGIRMPKFIPGQTAQLAGLFKGLKKYNQPVNHLVLGDLDHIEQWFQDAWEWNQPVDKWRLNTGVRSISYLFNRAYSANPDISMWEVENILFMIGTFMDATSFNPDFSKWNFNKEVDLTDFVSRSGLMPDNYDKLLKRLRNTDFTGRTTVKYLGADSIKYTAAGKADRDWLVADGWTIVDGGQTTL
ncbi:BspA family leucine-rich repeat surface protein [Elizabethkingia anophelis]|nr:BspA family leucine-rich repeat surface protein [Elizabethkingia anophelis]